MKKLFALVLTLALVLALGTTVFAAGEITAAPGSASQAITATVATAQAVGNVISVDVTWDVSAFTYTPAYNSAWNTETHTYTEQAAAWTGSASVTVANHSNVDVTANVTFTPAENSGINGTVAVANSHSTTLLAGSNDNGTPVTDSLTATLTITGGAIAEAGTIGTLTVAITTAA